jgi:OmcA/MtrC family decaheme c-type cytochrome
MTAVRRFSQAVLLSILAMFVSAAHGQATFAWEQTRYFQYNIENVTVTPATTLGSWTVKVIFSVSDPTSPMPLYWNIKTDLPFQSAAASVTVDFAWDGREFTNAGSENPTLAPIVTTALGGGAALPVLARSSIAGAKPCSSTAECPVPAFTGRYFVTRTITPVPFTTAVATGRVAIEGRPVCNGLPNCPPPVVTWDGTKYVTTYVNIPVKSATADFKFENSESAMIASQRRQIVDIAKCKGCHDGQKHGDTVVPRLSLHGANRNENLDLCVVCHNPNQTDVPYRFNSPADPRIGGPETPIDFKTMVHSIHAGGFRKTPYVVIGRNSSVNDFSEVRFPAELRKSCLKCHVVDASGKGSFELPLKSTVLGTTVKTQSVYQVASGQPRTIDVNPANDLKITPTAATCSACHDNSEVRSHMIKTGGASFGTTQDKIGTTVKERCANCHGPGKEKDVRKVHELSSSSSD